MLHIEIPATEYYDERNNRFLTVKSVRLTMEHSLLSISKWESVFHKPFLGDKPKTLDETIEYYKCMTLTKNVDPIVFYGITPTIQNQIQDYINDSMTATWFSEINNTRNDGFSKETITSEIIYYWMVTLNIPFECQKWHLNRLVTLIRTISAKNNPPKKMKRQELMLRNAELNAKRKAAMKSKG